jgi:putative tryptophan/tyrosine transport system substrate-binding protein
MQRREFITFLGGAVASWPIVADAQSTKSPARIGFLPIGSQSNAYDRSLVEAFRRGLADVGILENRDVVLDIVWVTGDPNAAVSELLQRGVDLLVPCGSSASVAAGRQTSTIPILFIAVGNPIGVGLVESLPHPGRNATGFSDILADLSGKYVEIARELDRSQASVDYLWHMRWPDGQNRFEATVRAADALGVNLRARGIGDVTELDDAIIAIKQSGAVAVIVQPGPLTFQQRAHIIDFATKQGLGTVYAYPAAGRDGALIAYGPDYVDIFRRAANYVDRIILKGARPANLPVQQPVKIDLIVNLKTAKALGLTIPPTLLARATEVIE